MKIGLVLEGGALRGLFTAGALDFLMDEHVTFDYIAGLNSLIRHFHMILRHIMRRRWNMRSWL